MTDRLTDDEIRHLLDACAMYPAGDDTSPAPLRVGEAVYVLGELLMLRRVRDAAITVGDEMSAEVEHLRARVAELEAERWPIPGTEGDERYTARVLLGRVVAAAAGKARRARVRRLAWATLGAVTGLGSGYAQALCRACGYDPDTGAELAQGGSDE